MRNLPELIPMPVRPSHLPFSVKWLSGEGAGSWFSIIKEKNSLFEVSRFSPEGDLECKGTFKTTFNFLPKQDFTVTYPSHCQKISIIQDDTTITLTNVAT